MRKFVKAEKYTKGTLLFFLTGIGNFHTPEHELDWFLVSFNPFPVQGNMSSTGNIENSHLRNILSILLWSSG